VKGLPGSAELRKRLHAVVSLDEVESIFADYLADREKYAERAGADADESELEAAEV